MKLPLLALALLTVAGCMSTNTILLGAPTDRPEVAAEHVTVYRTADQVPGQYEEVALLASSGSSTYTSESRMVESMQERAGKLGANAIILDATSEPGAAAQVASALFTLGMATSRRGKAVAIRVLPTPEVDPAPADPARDVGRATPARPSRQTALEPTSDDPRHTPAQLGGACMMGNVDEVKRLIAAGVDPNGKFDLGAATDVTPLRFASMFNIGRSEDRVEIVRLLIAAGAHADETNQGMSLLHHAVMYAGDPAIIEPLVAAGLNVNAKNRNGRTALHGAGLLGKTEWAEALIKNGADVNARSPSGEAPLDLAVSNDKKEVAEVLRKAQLAPPPEAAAEGNKLPVARRQGSEELPGAEGPRVEFLDRHPGGIELLDVTVEVSGVPPATEAPVVLPTGMTRLCIVIRTRGRLPQLVGLKRQITFVPDTHFTIAIANQDGLVTRDGAWANLWDFDEEARESTLTMCPPSASDQPYPDGPYACTLTVGDVAAAVLNWSVGARVVASADEPSAQPAQQGRQEEAAQHAPARTRSGLSLTGAGARAEASTTVVPSGTTLESFTVEAWIYPTAAGGIIATDDAYSLILFAQSGAANHGVGINFVVRASNSATGITEFRSVRLNEWNHVAGMFDASTRQFRIAINGIVSPKPGALGEKPFHSSPSQHFTVGGRSGSTDGTFQGRIDEVRVSDVVRYTSDFAPPDSLTQDENTRGLWLFDESPGATSFGNTSGSGNILTGLNGADIGGEVVSSGGASGRSVRNRVPR